ncbi:hypothetical protein Taro_021224, partial [Colocasia esculenta]|nr:hypothetical protein [Colocasia esculenta]
MRVKKVKRTYDFSKGATLLLTTLSGEDTRARVRFNPYLSLRLCLSLRDGAVSVKDWARSLAAKALPWFSSVATASPPRSPFSRASPCLHATATAQHPAPPNRQRHPASPLPPHSTPATCPRERREPTSASPLHATRQPASASHVRPVPPLLTPTPLPAPPLRATPPACTRPSLASAASASRRPRGLCGPLLERGIFSSFLFSFLFKIKIKKGRTGRL